jgi:hypothetical protein
MRLPPAITIFVNEKKFIVAKVVAVPGLCNLDLTL